MKKKKWKKAQSKSAKSQKHKSKIKGEKQGAKKESQKGKKTWEKMDLSICIFFHLFCFLDWLLFCIYFAVCLEKTCKIKATKKQIEKAKYSKCKWTSPFVSMFFPFLTFFFSPFILLPVFSGLKFCFLIVHLFSFFLHFFKFKNH